MRIINKEKEYIESLMEQSTNILDILKNRWFFCNRFAFEIHSNI